ncbi:MAG TPA: molybdenum cofactor biosynthesis protein MoaE [Candidatus Dormibacteraeota bacterium]|nr:molybdenum cofactor biosynthesis protein MoaE [Candidatus Dormibacteraeota bacterium]
MADIAPLTREPIAVESLFAALAGPADGAVASFAGVVRDNQDGRAVDHLEYEAHEPMAEMQMAQLGWDATGRWGLSAVRLQHRLGPLAIGEVSVFIGVAAPHRAEALEACRWLIDTLKAEVPIFKKEFFRDGGTNWVEEPEAAG